MALTNKQKVFINEYLRCWNATEAARLAGYAHPNKSGPDNLVKIGIKKEINDRMSKLAMSADEVVYRLGKHAKSSIGDFLTVSKEKEGEFYIDLDRDTADLSLIKKLKHKRVSHKDDNGNIASVDDYYEIELHDPQAALVHLGKHHGIFAKDRKIELSWKDKVPEGQDPSDLKEQFKALMRQRALELEQAKHDD